MTPEQIKASPWYLWLERRYGDEIASRIISETAAQARAELIAKIQAAVNHIEPPPGITQRGAEYFKAGARRAIDAMNSAIDKE